jgi:hypothetical protein
MKYMKGTIFNISIVTFFRIDLTETFMLVILILFIVNFRKITGIIKKIGAMRTDQ